jgi:hypothetical protein
MTPSPLRRVASGYVAIFKPILFVLTLLAGSAAIALAIAWPLWFFATTEPFIYTLFTLGVIGAAAVALAISSRRRAARSYDASAPGARRHPVLFALFVIGWILVFLAALYTAVLFTVRGRFYIGVPLLAAALLALGLAAWAAARKK